MPTSKMYKKHLLKLFFRRFWAVPNKVKSSLFDEVSLLLVEIAKH
jgi:hypothetical protein